MTSLNLATIFGPNLLHKLKNSDKEFVVQSFARAEESSAVISVVQKMISAYDTLFMVRQASLLQTKRHLQSLFVIQWYLDRGESNLIKCNYQLYWFLRVLSFYSHQQNKVASKWS